MANDKTIGLTLRLPSRLKRKAAKRAKAENRSLNQHIVFVLDKDLRETDQQESAEYGAPAILDGDTAGVSA